MSDCADGVEKACLAVYRNRPPGASDQFKFWMGAAAEQVMAPSRGPSRHKTPKDPLWGWWVKVYLGSYKARHRSDMEVEGLAWDVGGIHLWGTTRDRPGIVFSMTLSPEDGSVLRPYREFAAHPLTTVAVSRHGIARGQRIGDAWYVVAAGHVLEVGGQPEGLVWTPEGAVVGGVGDGVFWWAPGERSRFMPVDTTAPPALSDDGRWLAALTADGEVQVFEPVSGRLAYTHGIEPLPSSRQINGVRFRVGAHLDACFAGRCMSGLVSESLTRSQVVILGPGASDGSVWTDSTGLRIGEGVHETDVLGGLRNKLRSMAAFGGGVAGMSSRTELAIWLGRETLPLDPTQNAPWLELVDAAPPPRRRCRLRRRPKAPVFPASLDSFVQAPQLEGRTVEQTPNPPGTVRVVSRWPYAMWRSGAPAKRFARRRSLVESDTHELDPGAWHFEARDPNSGEVWAADLEVVHTEVGQTVRLAPVSRPVRFVVHDRAGWPLHGRDVEVLLPVRGRGISLDTRGEAVLPLAPGSHPLLVPGFPEFQVVEVPPGEGEHVVELVAPITERRR